MNKVVFVVLLSAIACHTASPTEVLEARHKKIEEIGLGSEPEDLIQLFAIASGRYVWPESVDQTRELQTRCWALLALDDSAGPWMPQQYIGAVTKRYADHLDRPEVREQVQRLLEDHEPRCRSRGGQLLAPTNVIATLLTLFPIPGMRSYLERNHLERQVAAVDRLAAWHPNDAARRVETLVADGTALAFHNTLATLGTASADERADAKPSIVAALVWLRLRLAQRPELRCCGPLKVAMKTGDLGADVVARLTDPDPEIRVELLRILAMQPRASSRATLTELAAHDPDEDVRKAAADALAVIDTGGNASKFEQRPPAPP